MASSDYIAEFSQVRGVDPADNTIYWYFRGIDVTGDWSGEVRDERASSTELIASGSITVADSYDGADTTIAVTFNDTDLSALIGSGRSSALVWFEARRSETPAYGIRQRLSIEQRVNR